MGQRQKYIWEHAQCQEKNKQEHQEEENQEKLNSLAIVEDALKNIKPLVAKLNNADEPCPVLWMLIKT